MGVPSYFSWIMRLTKKYKLNNMLHPRLVRPTKRLYLDFNCGIHQAARESNVKTEQDIITNSIALLQRLIELVKPSELVYVSIDGSVPMGKCKQQRYRRFKSIKEKAEIDQIYKKWNVKREGHNLDLNMISPGTQFMKNLDQKLNEFFEEYAVTPGSIPHLKFVLSTSFDPGEGEHKIMNHLKEHHVMNDEQVVIYGLDADLIFLSLAQHHDQIFLVRENLYRETIEGEKPDYLYLHIGALKSNIIQLIIQEDSVFELSMLNQKPFNRIEQYSEECLINDYIFYNFFLGNDFVNKIYCLSIKSRGCEIMLQIYRYCLRYCQNYLVLKEGDQLVINPKFLDTMLSCLAQYEQQWWCKPHPMMHSAPKQSKFSLEQELENHGLVPPYLHDLEINLHNSDFKLQYYSQLFDLSPRYTLEQNITYLCRKYWSTVRWTLEYYLNRRCVDWEWYYPFEYAPLLDDLIQSKKFVNFYPFQNNEPMDVHHQLMVILPPSSFNLLPPIYKRILHLQNFKPYFPVYFEYTCYGHHFIWECPPKIPILDSKKTKYLYDYLSGSCPGGMLGMAC